MSMSIRLIHAEKWFVSGYTVALQLCIFDFTNSFTEIKCLARLQITEKIAFHSTELISVANTEMAKWK